MDDDLFFPSPGTLHYNIKFVGNGLRFRATAQFFKGLDLARIEWVWVVEEQRHATPEEIVQLCRS